MSRSHSSRSDTLDRRFAEFVAVESDAAKRLMDVDLAWRQLDTEHESPISALTWRLARNQAAATLLRQGQREDHDQAGVAPTTRARADSILLVLGAWNLVADTVGTHQNSDACTEFVTKMRRVGELLAERLARIRANGSDEGEADH